MDGKAAVDVDLANRAGNLKQLAVVGFVIAVSYYYYGSGSEASAGQDEAGDKFWLLWTLVWAFTRLFQLVAGLALMLLLVLVVRQRSILYVPEPPGCKRSPRNNPGKFSSPEYWNMEFENVFITTEDGVKINGWFMYQRNPSTVPYTVLYFHGNAANIGHRLENLKQMYDHLKVNILIIDYRGYGDSEDGAGPSEVAMMVDAKSSYRWIIERIRNPPATEKARMSADRVLFFGRSIGGVVAVRLGALLLEERLNDQKSHKPLQPLPAGFILENTFTNLRDMAIQVFPFLYYLRPLLRKPLIFDEWKGDASLTFLAENLEHWCVCFLSGEKDTLVPPAQMNALREVVKQRPPKVLKFFKFPEGGHNDTPTKGGIEYWNSVNKFMNLVVESEPERKKFFEANS